MAKKNRLMADVERLAVACYLTDLAARGEPASVGGTSDAIRFWEPVDRTGPESAWERETDRLLVRRDAILRLVRDQDAALDALVRDPRVREHAAHAVRRVAGLPKVNRTGQICHVLRVAAFGWSWRTKPQVTIAYSRT